MSRLVVRLATVEDAPAIARIHNDVITDRVATFETEPRTAARVAADVAGKGGLSPSDGRAAAPAPAFGR